MPNKLLLAPLFETRYKRLAKKYASLEREIDDLIEKLIETPTLGEPMGAGLYKIRLAVKSQGKGKRGGFRVITYLVVQAEDATDVYLLTLYDKSEDSTIRKETLLKLVETLFP